MVFFPEAEPFSSERQPWETKSTFSLPEYLVNIIMMTETYNTTGDTEILSLFQAIL